MVVLYACEFHIPKTISCIDKSKEKEAAKKTQSIFKPCAVELSDLGATTQRERDIN